MLVYAVSKNSGPSYQLDPIFLVYLGTSIQEAEEAVGDFTKYQKEKIRWPRDESKYIYTALPKDLNAEMIQYFMADGWWYSIFMFELKE